MNQLNSPFFSIIVPVYNTLLLLPDCIQSIQKQTFRNYECILVDDGSTDDSGIYCESITKEDNRFICIHKTNGGASQARNFGIRQAAGKYILFVDSDDYWDDNKALEDIYGVIERYGNPDVVCFGVTILDCQGKVEKTRFPEPPTEQTEKENMVRHLVYKNQYISAAYVKALRNEFIHKNDIYFIEGIVGEDIGWSAQILVLCDSMAVYPNAFYYRIRRSEGSVTSSITERHVLDILNSIESGIAFAKEYAENKALLKIYYEYWAYQYAMLYGLLVNIKDSKTKSIIYSKMTAFRWLLKYDHVNKVRFVHLLVRLFGVRGAGSLLSCLYKIRYK